MIKSLLTAGCEWTGIAWNSFCRLLGVVRSDRKLLAVFVSLLVIDMCWILWFGVARFLDETGIDPSLYRLKFLRITAEGSWPEWFNYAKTLALVVILGYLARSTRQLLWFALAVVFTAVLVDDSLAIHERLGEYFVQRLDLRPMLGLRVQDVGEVIAFALFALVLAPLIVIAIARADRDHAGNALAVLLPLGALVFCAVIVDQLYNLLHEAFFCSGILLDMIEDGGEMIATTTACALAAAAVKA